MNELAAWFESQGALYRPRPSGSATAIYEGRFFVGRVRRTRRYWNVFIKDSSISVLLQHRFEGTPGIRMVRPDFAYGGTTMLVEFGGLAEVLDFVVRTRARGWAAESATAATFSGEPIRDPAVSVVTTIRRPPATTSSRRSDAPDTLLALLRSAGSCPLRQQADVGSPCRPFCRLGLAPQEYDGATFEWVTALGWGNVDSDLFIVGTTPRFHTLLERPGPNYARAGVDREDHAEWFSTTGFEEFQQRPASLLARTTKFQQRLIAQWGASQGREVRAFNAELMICPQLHDPPGRTGIDAMRYCFEQNLGKLLRLRSEQTTWLLTLGAKNADVLGRTLQVTLPRPTRLRPIASKDLFATHRLYWIGIVSPAGGGGGAWDDLIASAISARDQLLANGRRADR